MPKYRARVTKLQKAMYKEDKWFVTMDVLDPNNSMLADGKIYIYTEEKDTPMLGDTCHIDICWEI